MKYLIILLMLILAGCSQVEDLEPTICDTDECIEDVLLNCKEGTYIHLADDVTNQYTFKGVIDGKCEFSQEIQISNVNPELDDLSMTCQIPMEELELGVFISLEYCEGSLIEHFITSAEMLVD